MKLYVKNFIFSIALLIFLVVLTFLMEFKFDLVGWSFFLNLLFSCFYLSISLQNKINSILFYYIFNLIFFVIVPWFQYTSNTLMWSSMSFSSIDYLSLNIILFVTNSLLILFYYFSPVFNIKKHLSSVDYKKPNYILSILICILCFIIIFYSQSFNPYKLIFRGMVDDDNFYDQRTPLIAILTGLARLLPVFIFFRFFKEDNIWKKSTIFLFVILCAFPLSIPRFMVAYIYLPILLAYIHQARNSLYITSFMFISLFLIFPFLNQFRYFSFDNSIALIPDFSFLNEGHFDAYQNFMDVIRLDFVTYGYQILGVFLFFIPRVFWESKPVGSGYQLAENYSYSFNNISMPYIAEGYVNFGFIGIFLFVVILAFIMKQIDTKLLSFEKLHNNDNSIFFGFFLCAGLFFMFRGDLMSSYGNLLAGILSYYIAKRI